MAEKKTTITRPKNPRNGLPVPLGKKFSKENQPSGKAKSDGKQKKKFGRELLKSMLDKKFLFGEGSQLKEQLIKSFGPDVLKLSVLEIMNLMQMQKAILKGDTAAFNSVVDQALGRPAQAIMNVDEDGNVIPGITLTFPKGMDISLPSNTDGNDDQ